MTFPIPSTFELAPPFEVAKVFVYIRSVKSSLNSSAVKARWGPATRYVTRTITQLMIVESMLSKRRVKHLYNNNNVNNN